MKKRQLLLVTVAAFAAVPAAAQARETARHEIRLPGGRLDTALMQVAQQTGVQLVFTDPAIARLKAPKLEGRYTIRDALDLLLANSRYTYRFTGPNSVRVMPKSDAQPGVRPVALYQDAPASTSTGDQQAAAETAAVEQAVNGDEPAPAEIVVVGSQIRGSKVTAALPVTVVDEAQIGATGATSGDELFRSIPQLGDVSFNSSYLPNSSNSARGDVGSINLRNLGVGNTLVLLNGRRVVNHPTSRADDNLVPVLTVNTNAIPVFGLERMEVLRDGAAAIYGSDAVAGVVNTVLKTDYNGVELEGQVGWGEGSSLFETNTHLLAGRNLGDRGNITLFASYDKRDGVMASDFDYTRSSDLRSLFAGTRFDGSTSLDGRSTITPWGSFQTVGNVVVRQGTTALTNTSGQFHIQPTSFTGCPAGSAGIINGTNCVATGTSSAAGIRDLRFDAPLAFNTNVTPNIRRINLFLNGHYELGGGVELFGEAGYYNGKSNSLQASTGTLSSGPLTIAANAYYNPFGPTGSANRLPGINAAAAGQAITLSSYNFADVGPNHVDVLNTQYRLLAGLRFNLLGLQWESAALYSEARVRDTSDGISQTLLQRQINLTTPDAYNPFNGSGITPPSGGDNTPSSLAAINAVKVKTTRVSKSTLAMWDIKGSTTDLFSLPGGNVGMAIGGEVRRETQNDDRDARVDGTIQFTDSITGAVNGSDLIGTSPSPDTSGRRTVAAAYLEFAVPVVSPEMNIPLVRNIELQLAGRFEHYSDVGSVAKPKVAAAWDIVRGIRVRGSYAEGFKAPNLEQINATLVTRSNTRTDYVRCEAQLRTGAISSFANCSQGFATTARRSGNPDLKPEQSKTWTVGVVLEPHFLDSAIGRITLTADYWHVDQKGIVGLFGEGNALINDYLLRVQGSSDPNVIRAAPTAEDNALFAGTGLTPVGRVLYVNDKYVNLLPQEVAGVDLGLNWRLPDFGAGKISLNANAAYLDKFFLEPSPPIQNLIAARAAGTINAGTNIADAGDLVRQNGKPRWKVTGSITWEKGPFQIGGFTQYTSDVDDTGLLDSAGAAWLIEDRMTFNLYGQVTVGKRDNGGRYRLRIGVRNLTNEGPPLSSSGFLGSLYSPYGRYWYANMRASF
ncbi:outer membrane receptor protein involved in Fe transport [Sphingomonas kyeonggiensis]|uniref:TonB-dependent receptor n=1 Tax=Sphingomonas kyeonggiensis TaxID=1268553 RepID=UPI002785ED63|nr:TonB-dependent receptor [Sphingomonas kyeonggiensis]MDQ0252270.1 outer membrane receptor protein involved in Fe transport [Sphingomonas kyeonggiensis]